MNQLVVRKYRLASKDPHFGATEEYSDEFLETCLGSYRKNLRGTWSEDVLRGDFSGMPSFITSYNRMQAEVFDYVSEKCRSGDDVLLIDIDTVCVRPTEIFGRYDRMVVPWGSPSGTGGEGAVTLSGSVIYLPSTVSEAAWEAGRRVIHDVPPNHWAGDQDAYNAMARVDGPITLVPALNYNSDFPKWIRREEAHILSFHGSRGRAEALQEMKRAVSEALSAPTG